MGGGDLNLKKSWHPSTLRNIERVWKAEQKHEVEQQKIEQLQKELAEERAREEIQAFAEDQGVVRKKDERLDWMYQGPSSVNRDEYLLGRKIDKTLETLQQVEKGGEPEKEEGVGIASSSMFSSQNLSGTATVDLAVKIREDPLFSIMKKEKEERKSLLTNPVKMKQLQELLKASLSKSKSKKNKKNKKKKRQDSDSDEEKQYKVQKKHRENDSDEEKQHKKHKKHHGNDSGEKKQKKQKKQSRSYSSESEEDQEPTKALRKNQHSKKDKRHNTDDESPDRRSSNYERNSSDYQQSKRKIPLLCNNYGEFTNCHSSSSNDSESDCQSRKKKFPGDSNDKRYTNSRVSSNNRETDHLLIRSKNSSSRVEYVESRHRSSHHSENGSHRNHNSKPYKSKSYSYQEADGNKADKKGKLDARERERLLQEMQENAKWREGQRKRNLQRYKEEEEREKESTVEKVNSDAFLKPLLSKAAGKGSLEDRLKQKIFSIQRNSSAMDKNFARRE